MLSRKQLLQVYYGLFNSIAVYGVIGWGGLYNNSFDPLRRLQQRLLNIIGIKNHDSDKPLDIKQVFVINSILYNYSDLKEELANHKVNTRFKNLALPKHNLLIRQRTHTYYGKKFYNKLSNRSKTLECSKKVLKHKIKSVIKNIDIEQ